MEDIIVYDKDGNALPIYDKDGNVIEHPDLTKGHIWKINRWDEELQKSVVYRLEYEEGEPHYPIRSEDDPTILKARIDEQAALIEELTLFAADIVGGSEEEEVE